MPTFEGLPGDEELLEAFPEAAGFLDSGEGVVALEAIMSTLLHENEESLGGRFDAVRTLFDIYKEKFTAATPAALQWQSFHLLKRADGEHRFWVLNDSPNSLLRVVSNEEVRNGAVPTIHYREFAVHPTQALFGRRSGSATRPVGAQSWQAADLGTCSIMERARDQLRLTRGAQGGPPVLFSPESGTTAGGRIYSEGQIRAGLADLEKLMAMFVGGSCYEPAISGKYKLAP